MYRVGRDFINRVVMGVGFLLVLLDEESEPF